jgi:hypothetical protein
VRKAKKKEEITSPKGKAKPKKSIQAWLREWKNAPMLPTFLTKDQLRVLKRSLSGYAVHYMEKTNSWLCDGCGMTASAYGDIDKLMVRHTKDCPHTLHEAAVNALPCPDCGRVGSHVCRADAE